LPRYLSGVHPLEPGWSRWMVKPILAGLDNVDAQLCTPMGRIKVALQVEEGVGNGVISLKVPIGSVAEVFAPEGWLIMTSENVSQGVPLAFQIIDGQEREVAVRIYRISGRSKEFATLSLEKSCVCDRAEGNGSNSTCAHEIGAGDWFNPSTFLRRLHRWLA